MQCIYALHMILNIDQYFPYKSNERQVLLLMEVQ